MCRTDSVRCGLVGRTCGRGIGGPGGASALSDLSLPRRVCVVSNYALARPWSTFLMCPIELDPVQLVMGVYPFTQAQCMSGWRYLRVPQGLFCIVVSECGGLEYPAGVSDLVTATRARPRRLATPLTHEWSFALGILQN